MSEISSAISSILKGHHVSLNFHLLQSATFSLQDCQIYLNVLESHGQDLKLSSEGVMFIADLMSMVAAEFYRANKYDALSQVFCLGSKLGCNIVSVCVRCRQLYGRCNSWSNFEFWLYALKLKLRRLLQMWRNTTEKNLIDVFGDMPNSESFSMLVVCTIQSILSSMYSVGLSTDRLFSFLDCLAAFISIKDCGIDLRVAPKRSFLLHTLHVATLYTTTDAHDDSHQKLWTEYEVGFCPVVELVLGVAARSSQQDKKGCVAAQHRCLCCQKASKWKLLGGLDSQHFLRRSEDDHASGSLCSVVCELCYRQLFSDPLTTDRLHLFATGVCPTPSSIGTMESFSFYSVFTSVSAQRADIAREFNFNVFMNSIESFSSDCDAPQTFSFQTSAPVKFSLKEFIVRLWSGFGVKVIYSGKPVVEKQRVLFLRSDSHELNVQMERVGLSKSADGAGKLLIDSVCAGNRSKFYLCWAHLSEKDRLTHHPDKSIRLDAIKHIKVGANKWKQCINIASEQRTLVVKVEEETVFSALLEGLLAVVADKKM